MDIICVIWEPIKLYGYYMGNIGITLVTVTHGYIAVTNGYFCNHTFWHV